VNEFELIDAILSGLGEATQGADVIVGPGDDCSAMRTPTDELLVSSIDSLLADVHFPTAAPAELIGYRALMVALSDLAAMGARASQVLVSLTLAAADPVWVTALARGMAEAASAAGVPIVGGNISRGGLAIHISVHGFAPETQLLRRSGAQPGDRIYVTGALGGAAAALQRGALLDAETGLDALNRAYFRPQARLAEGVLLRGVASSAMDVSDGLLQDLTHLCTASALGARIDSSLIPLTPGASLDCALSGGDDYELLFTAGQRPPELNVPVAAIGEMVAEHGLWLDGEPVTAAGYQHF
jgi:thiamine-monophosphate kinase